jgi:hypothetical protein
VAPLQAGLEEDVGLRRGRRALLVGRGRVELEQDLQDAPLERPEPELVRLGQHDPLDPAGEGGIGVVEGVGEDLHPPLVQVASPLRGLGQRETVPQRPGAAQLVRRRAAADAQHHGQFLGEGLADAGELRVGLPPRPAAGPGMVGGRVLVIRAVGGEAQDHVGLPGGQPRPLGPDPPQLGGLLLRRQPGDRPGPLRRRPERDVDHDLPEGVPGSRRRHDLTLRTGSDIFGRRAGTERWPSVVPDTPHPPP